VLVPAKVVAREGAIIAFAGVADRDMGRDPAANQPTEIFDSIGTKRTSPPSSGVSDAVQARDARLEQDRHLAKCRAFSKRRR
jgi:hypothetical protein